MEFKVRIKINIVERWCELAYNGFSGCKLAEQDPF